MNIILSVTSVQTSSIRIPVSLWPCASDNRLNYIIQQHNNKTSSVLIFCASSYWGRLIVHNIYWLNCDPLISMQVWPDHQIDPCLPLPPPPTTNNQHHKTPPNWMVMVRNRVIYMTGGLNTGLTDWLFPENWILIKTADLTAIFSFISGLFGFTWYFPRKDHLNKILLHCHWYFVNKNN